MAYLHRPCLLHDAPLRAPGGLAFLLQRDVPEAHLAGQAKVPTHITICRKSRGDLKNEIFDFSSRKII